MKAAPTSGISINQFTPQASDQPINQSLSQQMLLLSLSERAGRGVVELVSPTKAERLEVSGRRTEIHFSSFVVPLLPFVSTGGAFISFTLALASRLTILGASLRKQMLLSIVAKTVQKLAFNTFACISRSRCKCASGLTGLSEPR